MTTHANRPTRIAPDQVDSAVDEALKRVQQGNELSKDELDQVSGGTPPVIIIGFMPNEPEA